jgi:O-antigen ligase
MQMLSGAIDYTGSRLTTIVTLALAIAAILSATALGVRASGQRRGIVPTAVASGFLIAGLLGTLAQWIQLFHLEPQTFGLVSPYFYDTNRRLWGNLNQPNHQATVHGLALVASVWLASQGKLRVTAWLIAVLLLETGIVLSGSRTGVLHVGLATIYALIAAWLARDTRRDSNPMRRPTGLVFAAVAMVAMLFILQPAIKVASDTFGWSLFDTVAQLQAADQTSARSALWAHAWAMFKANPWFGVGWGEFGWAQFNQLEHVGVRVEMSLHAHNAILDLLAKTGIVGTAGVAIALATWLWRVIKVRLWRGDNEERQQTVVVLTWLAMLCAHSMLEYPLHYLYFFLPFCFMLGWLEPSGFGQWRVPRAAARFALIAFVVISGWILVTMWQDYRRTEAREYASVERNKTLPMPRFWFRPHAQANRAEQAVLTADNAAQWLPSHIAAVHLLPTPTMIARTAWLFALTGQPEEGRLWLERLRFYYAGDEAAQFRMVAKACQDVEPTRRPVVFCDWVDDRALAAQNR